VTRGQTADVSAVLVVDDEPIVLDVVRRYLERDGHRVVTAASGDEARTKIEDERPDLVLLDVMLPGETDGLALCRWIRSTSELPVILVTARGEESDRIVGLELGADDYVTKPFSPRELATRVKTVLRRIRPGVPPRTSIAVGALVIDAAKHEVLRAGDPLQLTAREFELLWFLASNPNNVFSRDQLMHRVWGYSSALDTGTVTVHMRRLREKVERDPSHPQLLETVWGVGYRLRA
jgi:two-component system, OmpR family, response regulator ResD